MKPELKAKWIAALRSGEYEQTTERMLDPEGGMCCLGVLADIQGLKVVPVAHTEGDDERELNGQVYCELRKMIGDTSLLSHGGKSITKEVVGMNDSGKTFDQIADWIKENL